MEKKNTKSYDFGCIVIIFLLFMGATALFSYDRGKNKAISDEKKEIMKSKEVKLLEKRLGRINKWMKDDLKTEKEKDILLQHRKDVIIEELEALIDTLDLVSIKYIKDELDIVIENIEGINDFDNLND